jgi:hypothetical protein
MEVRRKLLAVQWSAPVTFERREIGILPEPTMKALVIYDDISRAANTKAVLHRAARRADVTVKWDINPW